MCVKSNEQRGLRTEVEKLEAGSSILTQSSVLSPRSLEVNIEELVLHGFPPGDRYLIASAVEQELTRLLTERGVPSAFKQGSYVDIIDGGHFTISSRAKARNIGMQVAQAVHRGVS
jgi:ribulose 1,5-bisphosphate synthetase/thiazole synthase